METKINILRPSRLSHLPALAAVLVGCVPAAEKVTVSPQTIEIRDKMKIVELEDDQSFRVLWLPNYRDVYDHQLARYDAVVLSGAIDLPATNTCCRPRSVTGGCAWTDACYNTNIGT